MKRLIGTLCAVLTLAGPLASAAHAENGRRDERRGGEGRAERAMPEQRGGGWDRGARGGPVQMAPGQMAQGRMGRGQFAAPGRIDSRGGGDRGEPRWDGPRQAYAPPRTYYAPNRPAYAPNRSAYGGGYGGQGYGGGGARWNRGAYLPDSYRGQALFDYGRYRLRPPPRGYAWYDVGGAFLLVDQYTGQVLDVIN